MFNLDDVKILHMEPTTNCNARCPMCLRTTTEFISGELSLDQVKNLFSVEFIKQLEKMYMCGTYGDPATSRAALDIYRYFKEHNPNITLGMNTNGGIRYPNWWQELASIMTNPNDYVVFSIDGVEDTNHIYRQNVRWNKLMTNASAFIDAGGKAHWDMLVFDYNKHQVDDALTLAKQKRFTWFRAKVSRRYNRFPIEYLKPPNGVIPPKITEGKIVCSALQEKSIYVDASGRMLPCCWHAESTYRSDLSQWFNDLVNSWDNVPDPICKKSCLKNNSGTQFSSQWVKEVEINYHVN